MENKDDQNCIWEIHNNTTAPYWLRRIWRDQWLLFQQEESECRSELSTSQLLHNW